MILPVRCLVYYYITIYEYHWQIVIPLSVSQVRSLHDRGVRAAKINDFTEAIKNYNEALEIDDKDTSVLHARSLAYLQMGDFNSALQDSESIINIKPQSSQVGYWWCALPFCWIFFLFLSLVSSLWCGSVHLIIEELALPITRISSKSTWAMGLVRG